MSEDQNSRAERVARYKQERKKQLEAQFKSYPASPGKENSRDANSTSSEGPRATRASRLRAAAAAQENSSPIQAKSLVKKSPSPNENGTSRRLERDKSSKRKSNLNRALNSEEVPSPDDDSKGRRRRRRFFPSDILEQTAEKNNATDTAPLYTSTSPSTTSSSSRPTVKKSELSIHMENARKGALPSCSEMGKSRSSPISRLSSCRKSQVSSPDSSPSHDLIKENKSISKKMEEIEALTKETLARVENLTNKKKTEKSYHPSSILKRKSSEKSIHHADSLPNAPISILKRKASQDEQGATSTNHTPPVTFSPSVVEPSSSRRNQGILKKRRSLDESQVMRHRSCSPDVSNKTDSRSILKNQRRSSLEELTRTQSPEIHGILKRKTSRAEEEDHSLNSPQSILKRRSGASSAGSTGSTPHVSITTAVILAAAGGAEMVLESSVKPILKKKSFSDEHSCSDNSYHDTPKPILKKKSSTETDDGEDRPKRPILKSSKSSFDGDLKQNIPSEEFDMKPILKSDNAKPRLSFRGEERKSARRSHTVCSDFATKNVETREGDRDLKKPRPISVLELVKSFENVAPSTGAIPKRSNAKRNNDRYRTQPVTSNELEESLNLVRNPATESDSNRHRHRAIGLSSPDVTCTGNSFLDLSLSLGNASNLNSPGISGKMSSDSAFQSLGDGLELDHEEASKTVKLEPRKLEVQMKAIAEEAKKKRLARNVGIRVLPAQGSPNRFSTQPVTLGEVQEASKFNRQRGSSEDPGKSPNETSRTSLGTKFDSADVTYDEGISCNDSASDSENAAAEKKCDKSDRVTRKFSPRVSGGASKSNSDTTSDADSSGGREIRSIFKSENRLRVKQTLEGVLKSRSQKTVGNETGATSQKGSSVRRSQTQVAMPRTIAEIQARLQQSGESDWKKRLGNSDEELKLLNKYNDELSAKSILASKKDELDAASQQWKHRVEKSDAEKYSVAGRMEEKNVTNLKIHILTDEKNRRTPKAQRFKGKDDLSSTPVSPEKANCNPLIRSFSVPESQQNSDAPTPSGKKVVVSRPDDNTFRSFYESVDNKRTTEGVHVSVDDFDSISRESSLLVQKKLVHGPKKRGAAKNPVKALALRTDIADEYTEVITGVAERERKRLNVERLAKSSNMALEALAGLASSEDFKSVNLKKSSTPTSMVPFKDVMLLQIKGRRHVQTRLVEPLAASINEGDNYVLITSTTVYNYIGAYSNVIEQSRAADIVNHIQQTGDLGCKKIEAVTIDSKNPSSKATKFWKILGCEEDAKFASSGHPDEDEIYESNIIATNMIYGLEDNELVPLEGHWGAIPKIEMLKPTKIFVFDFGSEMYVWSGKNAVLSEKRRALKLAQELWDNGCDYSECSVCPLNVASVLGDRSVDKVPLKLNRRPDWALFAKLTQHRETILFKEKFLDWPDFNRIIRVRTSDSDRAEISRMIEPCEIKNDVSEPDLVIEKHHLGRGNQYFDEETKRSFEFDTLEVSVWRIMENQSDKLENIFKFYDAESYIIRWKYRMTVKGRELSGKPSKHAQIGRDRTVYFCWQGLHSSINEKGLAALLTVELDSEKAPQIRVEQGSEPAAFLRLFSGSLTIHSGRREAESNDPKLFIVQGELEEETCLIEVSCERASLRSKTSMVLVDSESVFLWNGSKSSRQKRRAALKLAKKLGEVEVEKEGDESEDFLDLVGGDRDSYSSLLGSGLDFDFTPRLFRLSSVSGRFEATTVLCHYRSEHSSPYPFLQKELYSASQPALFLIDNHHELWLWQGWWPEREESPDSPDQNDYGILRWQAERKAAMQTAVSYWRRQHIGDDSIPAYLVWAGLEPLGFKNLFPFWSDMDDVAELNIKEGRQPGAKLILEEELARLQRTTYSLSELLQKPLPEGVNPSHLEEYLSPEEFESLLGMTKEEFQKLPPWKQSTVKKDKGLF